MEKCNLYNTCKPEIREKCIPESCPKLFKINMLYSEAGFEPYQRVTPTLIVDECDYEAFGKLAEIRNNIVNFVNDGKNLFIHSRICGNGKTTCAIALVQNYFKRIWPKASIECHALFINVPRYLSALKDAINLGASDYLIRIKENVIKADIVIWDDIATKVASDYDIEQILNVVDARINAGKSNIFTSNLTIEEMKRTVGLRLASRISMSTDIEFKGPDRRNQKGKGII